MTGSIVLNLQILAKVVELNARTLQGVAAQIEAATLMTEVGKDRGEVLEGVKGALGAVEIVRDGLNEILEERT